jgi:molybdopterin biosynthesis enzyme MoaB
MDPTRPSQSQSEGSGDILAEDSQAMTVSGLTIIKDDRQSLHTSHCHVQKSRSADVR